MCVCSPVWIKRDRGQALKQKTRVSLFVFCGTLACTRTRHVLCFNWCKGWKTYAAYALCSSCCSLIHSLDCSCCWMKGLSARELIADADAVAGSRCYIAALLAVLSALLLLSCLLSVLAAAVLKRVIARRRKELQRRPPLSIERSAGGDRL